MEIRLIGGQFLIGDYSIARNYEDGYTVWKTDAEKIRIHHTMTLHLKSVLYGA